MSKKKKFKPFKKKLTKRESKKLWLFTIWIVVIFFFTFIMLNMFGPRISYDSLLKVPIIKSALEENPNVQINETFISKNESQKAVQIILEKCGEEVEQKDYVLVELEFNGSIINAYFDPVTQEAICVFTESIPFDSGSGEAGSEAGDESGGGSGGGAGGGTGGDGSTISCTKNSECDDSNPYTSDSCVSGFCENLLMPCSRVGGILCTIDESCNGTSVSAYDGACCLGTCVSMIDQCETDIDCDDSNPSTEDICEGIPKVCVHNLKACEDIGYVICSLDLICSGRFTSASDTTRCCIGKCIPPMTHRCDTDIDCPSDNPTLVGRCRYNQYGYRECQYDLTNICSAGDSNCPRGCTIDNDPDCQ